MSVLLGQDWFRHWHFQAYLLENHDKIADAAARLCPEDFKNPKPGKSTDKAAGALCATVFDAIINRGARSREDVDRILSSADNYHGQEIPRHYVDAVLKDMPHSAPELNYDGVIEWLHLANEGTEPDAVAAPAVVDSFENVSLAKLATNPTRHEYLVEGVLARGQSCLGLGHEKVGKTGLLGMDLGLSLATGTKFLNYFNVPAKNRVLFLSGESGQTTLVDTYMRVCGARGVDPTSVEGFEFSTWLPRFGVDTKKLGRRLTAANAEVLIIDPAGPCMSAGAAATLSIAYAELRSVSDVCSRHGATPILLHHATKGSGQARLGLRSAAGAGFAEWARQWLVLDRLGQFKPATGEHRLRFTAAGSAGHSGTWIVDWREGNLADADGRVWDVRVRPTERAAADKSDDKLATAAALIVAAMKALGRIETARAIRGQARMNAVKFEPAMAHLVSTGVVIERVITKGKQQRMGYELAAKLADADAAA